MLIASPSSSYGPRKPPTVARTVAALAVAALTLPATARGETLAEQDVIRLARERDPDVAAAREQVSVASARRLAAGLYPDPVLGWDREHLPGAEREDALTLSLPIDLSGRRSARRALAGADLEAARAAAHRSQSEAVVGALALFYDALAADRRAAIAARTAERLTEAARVLGRRHEEGTVSGYERHRLDLEVELARSQLREAEFRAQRYRDELVIQLAIERPVELRGELAVTSEADAAEAAGARPSVERARAAADRARAARRSARRSWIPPISLEGGVRIDGPDESRVGYVAGISFPLPVLSRGRASRVEAEAREGVFQARVRQAERSARLEAARAASELALATEELARFEEATADRVQRLVRAAESGYREGRRSIVELVDAERARAEVDLRRLELALAAKRAELAWRAAQGAFE